MDFGAVHNFALPSVGPNAAQCLGACSWSCGDHRLPRAELIPWAITPGSLEGTCFGQLLEKKAAWKGRRAKPRGDTSLSCPAGSQKAAAETKPTARSSCPGKEACSPYQQLRRLRQQTSCPRPSWRGSKMQSSALSPFSPGRFMTSA